MPTAERDIAPGEILTAEEMFCTGTMGEIAPVVAVDGSTIGTGTAGPVTTRLSGWFAERTAAEGELVVPG